MIELIVADIDNTFTGGGRSFLDLNVCARVAELNRASESDPSIPALVFCTGRPLSYVQCLQQACGSLMPSIAEFGAVLWCPKSQTHAVHPHYTKEMRQHYLELLEHAEREFHTTPCAVLIEAGKFCQMTLMPRHPATVEDLVNRAEEFARHWEQKFVVDRTPAVLNFMPPEINKGSGIEWLAEYTGVPLDRIAGIGDSDCDWRFLEKCAVSGAPSTARQLVRESCNWALESGPGDCVVEFYERVIERNRKDEG